MTKRGSPHPVGEDYERLRQVEERSTKAVKVSSLPPETIRAMRAAKLSHLPPTDE